MSLSDKRDLEGSVWIYSEENLKLSIEEVRTMIKDKLSLGDAAFINAEIAKIMGGKLV